MPSGSAFGLGEGEMDSKESDQAYEDMIERMRQAPAPPSPRRLWVVFIVAILCLVVLGIVAVTTWGP